MEEASTSVAEINEETDIIQPCSVFIKQENKYDIEIKQEKEDDDDDYQNSELPHQNNDPPHQNDDPPFRNGGPPKLAFEAPCKHNSPKFKCARVLLNDVIQNREAFLTFHKKVQQDLFLTRLIAPYAPKRRRVSSTAPEKCRVRNFSTAYFIRVENKNIPVCQAFFMKTFSLKKDRLHSVAKAILNGETPKDGRGGDRRSSKSIEKRAKLRTFFRSMAIKGDHYNHNKPNWIYLSCDLNISKLREMYNNSVSPEFQVKKTMFLQEFSKDVNVGFR